MNLVPSMFTNQSLVSQLVLGWHCTTHCQHTRNGMWLQSQLHVNCLHSQGANGWKLCCSLQSVGCRKYNWGNLLLLFSWICLNQRRHFINSIFADPSSPQDGKVSRAELPEFPEAWGGLKPTTASACPSKVGYLNRCFSAAPSHLFSSAGGGHCSKRPGLCRCFFMKQCYCTWLVPADTELYRDVIFTWLGKKGSEHEWIKLTFCLITNHHLFQQPGSSRGDLPTLHSGTAQDIFGSSRWVRVALPGTTHSVQDGPMVQGSWKIGGSKVRKHQQLLLQQGLCHMFSPSILGGSPLDTWMGGWLNTHGCPMDSSEATKTGDN